MLRVGIVGGGTNSAVGRAHYSALSIDGNWEIAAGFFSRNADTNRASQKMWNINSLNFTLEDFIEAQRGNLDLVIVLTPTPSHYSIIKSLLQSGFNVVSEKSLATHFVQADELGSIANSSRKKLYVTFNYTGYPIVRELKSRIKSGRYGLIKSIFIEMPQETFSIVDDQGNTKKVQPWRVVDYEIPTVSLDLGVHVNNLAHFLLGDTLKSVVSIEQHNGKIESTIDAVSYLAKFNSGIMGNFWFGKSFIGYRNGLRVRGFGELGSFEWLQSSPDVFWESNSKGENRVVDLADSALITASEERYQRFKPGHPTGFIEAFSNLYEDIRADFLEEPHTCREYIFGSEIASQGLLELLAVHKSSLDRDWQDICDIKP